MSMRDAPVARLRVRSWRRPSLSASKLAAKSSTDGGLSEPILTKAASIYAKGLEEGISEDDLVAMTLGAKDGKSLTPVQEQYRDKVKEQLAKKAAELKKSEADEEGYEEYVAGQRCYERGNYPQAERLLTQALDKSDSFSQFGGDVQIWLALALSANGKEAECIALFKSLEKSHPVPAIRKQAGNLCFIMEAPKLQISPDERVAIPVLELDPNDGKKKGSVRRPAAAASVPKVKKSFEDEFWENYKPPAYLRNKYVWAASAAILVAVALYYMHD